MFINYVSNLPQALFLIFGCTTFAWSIICYFALPNGPIGAWFLSDEDQIKAVERVQDNLTGIKSHKIKHYQVMEALVDPKTWLLALFQFTQNVPNGGVGSVSFDYQISFGPITKRCLKVCFYRCRGLWIQHA